MTLPNIPAVQIRPTPVAGRAAALRLVFQNLNNDVRVRQIEASAAALDGIKPEDAGLFEAIEGEAAANREPIGAIWVQLMPGRVGSIWPPQTLKRARAEEASQSPAASASPLTPDVEAALAGQLMAASEKLARRYGIRLLQALLPTDAGPAAESLGLAGFEHLADLLYLVSSAQAFPTAAPVEPLQYEAYSLAAAQRFGAVIERTYQDTLDCPQLDGIRTIDEVLEGYQAVGRFSPELWMLVQRDGRDVGCLLLADHPEQRIWELVYMGIVPEARGVGLGLTLARQAQWRAKRAGAERLVLAVDAANAPALRMYSAAGFVAWDRRSVFTKALRPAGA